MKLIFLSLLATTSIYASSKNLNEHGLLLEARKNPPSLKKIKAMTLQSKANLKQTKDIYSSKLEAEVSHLENSARLLNAFDGTTTRAQTSSLSVTRPLKYGAEIAAGFSSTQISNVFLKDMTTTGVNFNLSLDLYKNFLGRISRAELKTKASEFKRAKLEEKLNIKSYEGNIRKLYWSIVANQTSQSIIQDLLSLSKKQLAESIKRRKNSIADDGEVSRYKAQVASRTTSLLSLQYQHSSLMRSLKELIPELAYEDIQLVHKPIDAVITEVLQCTQVISQYGEAPMRNTFYDEINQFLNIEKENSYKVASSYADIDFKIKGQAFTNGRDLNYTDAFSDLNQSSKGGYSVAAQLTIPLGSRKYATETVKEKLVKKSYQAKIENNLGKLKSFHYQTVKSIAFLQGVVKNQKIRTKNLEQSLKVSKRKFNQARLTVQELVSEQDVYFQSSLDDISTQLTVIHTLIDYFSVFSDTPCSINRI